MARHTRLHWYGAEIDFMAPVSDESKARDAKYTNTKEMSTFTWPPQPEKYMLFIYRLLALELKRFTLIKTGIQTRVLTPKKLMQKPLRLTCIPPSLPSY